MKLATFVWSFTVRVPDDFDEMDGEQVKKARHEAYLGIQEGDGDLTESLRDEPEDP